MEVLEEIIQSFLTVGSGYGDGSGDGYGSGYGYGIPVFNGRKVYQVDGVPTIIDRIKTIDLKGSQPWQCAEGFILNKDFTLTPCFVAKVEGRFFAHGKTLHEAYVDACAKALKQRPLSERIKLFRDAYPDPDAPIPASELFQWHNTLTGSCHMGRTSFCKQHGIDLNGTYSVRYFLSLTRDAYGSSAIHDLARAYNITL